MQVALLRRHTFACGLGNPSAPVEVLAVTGDLADAAVDEIRVGQAERS